MKLKNIIIISAIVIFLIALELYKSTIKQQEGLEDNTEQSSFSTGLDVLYHADIDRDTSNDITLSVTDPSGNPTKTTVSKTLGNATYYKPGDYKYGNSAYVPNYEDANYLANVKNDNGVIKYNTLTDQEEKLQSLNQKTQLDEVISTQNQDFLDSENIRTSNVQGLFADAPTNKYPNNNSYPGNYVNIVKTPDTTADASIVTTVAPKQFNVGDFLNDSIYNTNY